MKNGIIRPCFSIILIFWLSGPALAQDQADKPALDVKQLQQTIDEQQKQLDAQQTQLDTQEKGLQQLRQQLQQFQGGPEQNYITPPSSAVRIFPRRNDLQTGTRDNDQSLDDWEGSLALNDSDTRIKIGGFLELDVIHDNNAIQSKGQFIADTIPTRNATKVNGAEGQTHFSVSPSRLTVETRTPVHDKRLKTFFSIDLFANELEVDAEPRLRQAYVELSGILFGGDLLIGQAWSTTADLESTPDVLDFRGPDALFGQLQPQVRWSKPLADGVKLMLAAETASHHIIEGADVLTRMPDGVMAITWDSHAFNFMGSLLVKDLRASANDGEVKSAVGAGVNLSGKVQLPYGEYPNDFMFSVTYGEGIASHFQNAKPDAVYDAVNNRLETLRFYGVTLAYRHSWNADMTSTVVYCCIEIYNHDAQAPDSIQGTEYSSGNFVWNINPHWLLGVEGIWGKRDDNDGAMASVFRTQFTSRVSF